MEDTKKESSLYRRFLGLFLGVTFFFLLGIIVLVTAVDPFFHYHAPLKGFPYVIDDQLTQNPGIAEHTEYEAISVGSSVSANYNISWFEEIFGLKTAKLPYNGAYPRDISNALELPDKSGHNLKAVFWAVDTTAYSANADEIKYPLPEHLYDRNPLNDVFYIFNKDVILDYILKPLVNRSLATGWDEYYNTHQYFVYGRENVLKNFALVEKSEAAEEPGSVAERCGENWDKYFKTYIEAHPGTTFYIYFPPRSVLYWYTYRQSGGLEALELEEELLIGRMLEYDNVRVFYFQDNEEITANLDNYTDTVHFGPQISRLLLESMAHGTDELHKDDYRKVIEDFWRHAEEFDYEGFAYD